ncbi:MAG: peptidyl-prolyl cis-trans isomerase [Phenylobacterium sp.]|uniref:peptidylprolyl isomerase n=1 Tax=Phenylobacterium sp. TaxID=1871053 RepID=UPI001A62C460|nr:peptidylprolyl isomerase [Phenylobacterium sp.]MBL8556207.1 peptidyl-prolyl cis-trans isomerase [Phenylobacterium sp.]
MSLRTVVFDGVEIPESLLAQEVQNHPGASAAEARAAAGHALAIRALLLNRAHVLRLEPEPERDAQGREETADEALVRAVLDLEVDAAAPTEAECLRVYGADPARFCSPTLHEAAHILIEPADASPEADAAARTRALRIADAVRSGACTFAEMARDHSDCPSGATGGSLGQLQPGDLVPEVESVLYALKPGAVAGEPVRSRFGWHVLKLDRRIEGRKLPFEVVEDRIRLNLEARAWSAAATRYVATLAAEARAHGVALSLTDEGEVREGSATLGDFLGDAAASERLLPWLQAVDGDLAQRVQAAAEAAGERPAEFARTAMADFVADANDERWTNLVSAARDAADPALACLAAVLRSKLVPAKQTFTVIRRVA